MGQREQVFIHSETRSINWREETMRHLTSEPPPAMENMSMKAFFKLRDDDALPGYRKTSLLAEERINKLLSVGRVHSTRKC